MKGKGEAVNAELLVIPPPNSFLNIDCMQLMKKCPDGYFDLALLFNDIIRNLGLQQQRNRK